MQNWLRGRNVPFCNAMLQVQFYEIIKAYKPKHKSFIVDEIMACNGHKVLRLPSYHQDLSPIELMRADVKQWVGANNTFRINDFKHLCEKR